MNIKRYIEEKKTLVNAEMEALLPSVKSGGDLHKAMRYSVEAGGKRIRPTLAIAACEAVGGRVENVIPAACAIEFIHTYSLIHDDLPAMDNDDFRRGRPTCHKAFDEATAILAGDALLTLAFDVLTRSGAFEDIEPQSALEVIQIISKAAGHNGMVGGQQADMEAEGKHVDLPTLEYIHTHKTGALILASIKTGALLGAGDAGELKALTKFGERVGLAFQVADDILDVVGATQTLGKDAGSDEARGKATYPAVMGLKESRLRLEELLQSALESLRGFDEKADPLREIARFVVNRES